jgi:hypothetical protein
MSLTEEQQNAITKESRHKYNYANMAISLKEAMNLLAERHPSESGVYNRLNDIYIQLKNGERTAAQNIDELRVSYGLEPYYDKPTAEHAPGVPR